MTKMHALNAELRPGRRSADARRMRRLHGRMPAIIYGGDAQPCAVWILHKEIAKAMQNECFHTQVLTISVDGRQEQVLLKDLQRCPAREEFLHADFLRVSAGQRITVRAPLRFLNAERCHGVKIEGGMLSHAATDLEVRCLQENLPEYIEIDVAELNVGDTIHISDLQLPEGVESVALAQGPEHDLPLVNVLSPRGGVQQDLEEMESEERAEAEAAEAAEAPEGEEEPVEEQDQERAADAGKEEDAD